ncbi:MAG: hypothetical protein Q4C20_01065 [Erysipelotrichaceae bacterium]|nr:hypothetical protein [Erysipelotrichaceae bacterium]
MTNDPDQKIRSFDQRDPAIQKQESFLSRRIHLAKDIVATDEEALKGYIIFARKSVCRLSEEIT